MKLKQITKLLFAIFFVFTISSCNDDSTQTTQINPAADAQIYSFKLAANSYNALDSATYPALATTKFAISQSDLLIYNPDSLPYRTRLKKFATALGYSSLATPSKVEILYADSVIAWDNADSIDYSLYPKIKVTAADGKNAYEYRVNILIRKVDPDTLVWTKTTMQIPTSVSKQKTLFYDDKFYTFSIDNNQFYLHTAKKSSMVYDSPQAASGLTGADIVLESITLYNGGFYAIDNTNKGYYSEDGVAWEAKADNILAIVGVLPADKADKDVLLVVSGDINAPHFSSTTDMVALTEIRAFNSVEKASFPISDFSSVSNINRSNLNQNILSVTGGKDINGVFRNLTWSMQRDSDSSFRIISNQAHNTFAPKAGIVSFLYDGYLYALTGNKLYKSSFGDIWKAAPQKEKLDSKIPSASAQSIIVDNENYIWIFGGVSSSNAQVRDIWKGRLNKLSQ
ncbi:hypothetical protein M2451_001550 [Dysgonomonas sp. PFB1-18]|uniref:DUF6242 domain-containing protein n=1 Tax=unclassified Dysgonomonas TaxID=2630389 RepID=UPI002475A9F6|nr:MULTISPECIES: DUF6242 domain-containing protein [unclassified Dysgonomonas]MDH6308992.1 hypothetical protein [Dysgonomonas sp. PF1-14]MDH6338743.1 hypothetical protein [Dysgonomonas sp. PF1-16]MDH6380229.1 hypothetical protein [Dysgonomonas sp. PFB1-18]MDH6397559.1 hypothetical protein [Dysgonomonas sp. PF1-23]